MPITLGARPEHGFDQPLGLLSDCHRRIENFLAVLQKVLDQADGKLLNDDQRRAVEAALAYFCTAAKRHTQDEEQSLFPLLRASERPEVHTALRTVESLQHEHLVANAAHTEVEFWYRRWLGLGPLAGPQSRKLRRLLAELEKLYRRHIEVEDREIFPLASQVLSPDQLTRLGTEMAERRGLQPSLSKESLRRS